MPVVPPHFVFALARMIAPWDPLIVAMHGVIYSACRAQVDVSGARNKTNAQCKTHEQNLNRASACHGEIWDTIKPKPSIISTFEAFGVHWALFAKHTHQVCVGGPLNIHTRSYHEFAKHTKEPYDHAQTAIEQDKVSPPPSHPCAHSCLLKATTTPKGQSNPDTQASRGVHFIAQSTTGLPLPQPNIVKREKPSVHLASPNSKLVRHPFCGHLLPTEMAK